MVLRKETRHVGRKEGWRERVIYYPYRALAEFQVVFTRDFLFFYERSKVECWLVKLTCDKATRRSLILSEGFMIVLYFINELRYYLKDYSASYLDHTIVKCDNSFFRTVQFTSFFLYVIVSISNSSRFPAKPIYAFRRVLISLIVKLLNRFRRVYSQRNKHYT